MVSNWDPAHSLVEYAISGAEIAAAPCLLALAVACLPLCLRWGREGLYAAGQLYFGVGLILCSGSRPGIMLQPFMGKFSLSLLFTLWRSHSLDCYLKLAPSGFPQGIQAQSFLTLSTDYSCPALLSGGECKQLGYFSTGSCG